MLRPVFGPIMRAAVALPLLTAAAAAQEKVPQADLPALPAPTQEKPADSAPSYSKRPPDIAFAAYQRGAYITAIREAIARIDLNPNDAPAMTLLGTLYAEGLGVPRDIKSAGVWYRRAHERGDVNATFALAMATLRGDGVERDLARGRELLEDAVRRGHGPAAYNLALIALGQEKPDFPRAASLFRIAAAADLPDAEYALAILLREGRGVPRSEAEAASFLRRAAKLGHREAQVEYAVMLFNGDGVAKDETAAARAFRQAAFLGSAIAQNRLARIYASGRGLPRDLVEAAAWHRLAIRQGLKDAWLDGELKALSPQESERADKLVALRTPS